jgi:hypothetical protein
MSEATSTRTRPTRPAKSASRPKTRARSGTASSSQTTTSATRGGADTPTYPRTVLIKAAESEQTPRNSSSESRDARDEQSTPEPVAKAPVKTTPAPAAAPPPPTKAAPAAATPPPAAIVAPPVSESRSVSRARSARSPIGTTDESDSDFQSAYSQGSSPEDEEEAQSPLPSEEFGVLSKSAVRDRVFSTATAVGVRVASGDTPTPTSPTFSTDAIAVPKTVG